MAIFGGQLIIRTRSDIQFFLDGHPKVDRFLDLPSCPFLDEMWNYCFLRSFPNPQVLPPLSADFPQVDSAVGVNYNDIFLALILTYTVLPSYERRPPAAYEDAASLEVKKSQILGLSIALGHAQECFGGKINGVFYWGLEFLSRLASAYGVIASFVSVEPENLDLTAPYDPSKIRIQHVHKTGRSHRGAQEILHFLRIYPSALEDLSSFILDLEWSWIEPFTQDVTPMSIRTGLKILLRGLCPNSWWSLVDTISYKGEPWMNSSSEGPSGWNEILRAIVIPPNSLFFSPLRVPTETLRNPDFH